MKEALLIIDVQKIISPAGPMRYTIHMRRRKGFRN